MIGIQFVCFAWNHWHFYSVIDIQRMEIIILSFGYFFFHILVMQFNYGFNSIVFAFLRHYRFSSISKFSSKLTKFDVQIGIGWMNSMWIKTLCLCSSRGAEPPKSQKIYFLVCHLVSSLSLSLKNSQSISLKIILITSCLGNCSLNYWYYC